MTGPAAAAASRKPVWDALDRAYFRRLGARIRAERERQGMTQAKLARAAGISRNFASKLEQGHHGCHVMVLVRVARALHVSVGALADDP